LGSPAGNGTAAFRGERGRPRLWAIWRRASPAAGARSRWLAATDTLDGFSPAPDRGATVTPVRDHEHMERRTPKHSHHRGDSLASSDSQPSGHTEHEREHSHGD
jgi:hypothetical protein